MTYTSRPFRSVLYIPGSKERALEKATGLACDAVIFDLEDAVAPDAKADARVLLAKALQDNDYGKRSLMVRINALDTEWGHDDLAEICKVGPEAILLPKVYSAKEIHELEIALNNSPACKETKIWAMMETPMAMLKAEEIAGASVRMAGFVLGTNDLLKDLGATQSTDRLALQAGLQLSLLAARAHGLICVDGVYNKFKDEDGLRVECAQGLQLGFDGKSLIHPAQLAISNEVFAPSAEALDLAHRQVAAFVEAEKQGLGIAVVDGQIVENLHVATAKGLIEKTKIIAEFGSA